ncbi:MAG: hypothetical protein ABI877_17080 [Gemmatimonadaceae bacterium]
MSESAFTTPSDRRLFLGRVAAAAAGAVAASSILPSAIEAAPTVAPDESDMWLEKLHGKYRQVFDTFAIDEGFGLAYAATFLNTQGPKPDAGAVVVLRHFGFPLAVGDDIWAKYKIGQALNVKDPATNEIAVRNPFLRPKSGVLLTDDMAIDKLLARGVIFGACNVALHVISGRLAGMAGVTPEVALKEWTAGVIPGIVVLPSGVWAVNRAQVAGCTYCTAG